MTRPLDRNARLPALGEIDTEAGEFWVENPFDMPGAGYNLSAYERNRVYLNYDGRSFLDASFASGANIDSDSRSVVAADFDRDGAPDLLVGSVGGGPLRLFLNSTGGRRVRLDLVGTKSNRSGIGARVVIEAGGRRMIRDIFPGNGAMGQSPPELSVGVGEASKIDRVTVHWPSGETGNFRDVPIGKALTLTEGNDTPALSAFRPEKTPAEPANAGAEANVADPGSTGR